MRQVENRIAWVISAVRRYHRKAAAMHGEDLGKLMPWHASLKATPRDACRQRLTRTFQAGFRYVSWLVIVP